MSVAQIAAQLVTTITLIPGPCPDLPDADAFAECARNPRRLLDNHLYVGYAPTTNKKHRDTCRLILRALTRP